MTDLQLLKNRIDRIKQRRKDFIDKVIDVYKSDSAFQSNHSIDRNYIKYIAKKEDLIWKRSRRGKVKKAVE